jgi:hypothetical protein
MPVRPPAPLPARLARAAAVLAAAGAAALAAAPARLAAQTDYYNTDAGRPLTVEDAYPVERRAVELQAAPLRLERALGGVYRWGVEPEVAVGLLPRTQLEVGLPLVYVDRGDLAAGGAGGRQRQAGVAGVDVSVLHNLNAETTRVPALAVTAGALLPAGALAPDHAYATLKAIATKTFPAFRAHLNAQAAFGPGLSLPAAGPGSGPVGGNTLELSRWLAGVAVDRPMPLRSLLVSAEAFARAPVVRGEPLEWNAGAGARWQATPRWALDAGLGRHLTGDDRGWYFTAGGAYALGLPWRRR